MPNLRLPTATEAEPCVRGILGALDAGGGPTDLQLDLLGAIARVLDLDVDPRAVAPLSATELAAAIGDPALRHEVVDLMVTLEMLRHTLADDCARSVRSYAQALDVDEPMLDAVRDFAHHHAARLHADILRNSWYTEETVKGFEHGRGAELLHSKASYFGAPPDAQLARKWRGLGDNPEGSWGRRVYDFYVAHGFPFPGERHGIYEVGALHDFVHALADYAATPEGEIDVFTFIAGTMASRFGFVLFVVTLCLFQNGAIGRVGGKRVVIACEDTLADPGAIDRWADAFWRSTRCTVDVMAGIDHFALAAEPLGDLLVRWDIPPKRVPGEGAIPA